MYFNAFNRETIRQKSWQTLNLARHLHESRRRLERFRRSAETSTTRSTSPTCSLKPRWIGAPAVGNVAKPRTYGIEFSYHFNATN